MNQRDDEFGGFSATGLAVANVLHGILSHVDEGIPKKKAEATTSEIVMLAGGIEPEHFGWIRIQRSPEGFEDSFQHLSIFVDVKGDGVQLLYRHILRDVDDENSSWIDNTYEGEAFLPYNGEANLPDIQKWIVFASVLFHRDDRLELFVPDDQRWF
jgi:hypothetical protein